MHTKQKSDRNWMSPERNENKKKETQQITEATGNWKKNQIV